MNRWRRTRHDQHRADRESNDTEKTWGKQTDRHRHALADGRGGATGQPPKLKSCQTRRGEQERQQEIHAAVS
jgi:hypothetical protein